MQIALLPLDERPVNVRLPADVAAIAGATVAVPPDAALPLHRRPGDVRVLGDWLVEQCVDARADAAVVSLDMLLHGGLIASRVRDDDLATTLARTQVLRTIRAARPRMPVSAVSVVMRASDSYIADEEPDYWTRYGRDLHALGGDLHRGFLGQPTTPRGAQARAIPDDVRRDFLRRRLRNHAANLAAVDLAAEGVVDPLLITADDTASRSAGSLEQVWLDQWVRALRLDAGSVMVHAGADEVDAVLVSRALGALDPNPVRMRLVCAEADGLDRVALYENTSVGAGAASQVRASGSVVVDTATDADALLVVHAPDRDRGDWRGDRPDDAALAPVEATVAAVRTALDSGVEVGVADVRYANGADPAVVERLRDEGLLSELAAYGGWNTAGNTLGSVVAALRACVVGKRAGTFDAGAARRLLVHRALEDWGYQALVRTRLTGPTDPRTGQDPAAGAAEDGYVERTRQGLELLLRTLVPGARLDRVGLPWHRSFEVDFDVHLPDGWDA
ncbi:hypothetical protein Xcel_2120 [Xylanimonas cellulosilytica DSM 15894]|uniref:DUF4127 family protein n=1 Tax=Xylanimonas cellulosilytica (strain DSM 15894 / JCM 12276 / CECT 5975 / KCTC 9989 / LMG 20990 / NBRC 107835 / XIL07) TaxID=446471 RepID=D1BUC5_XYLCX|nr:DUF4127 family protein [Xylanimonas cellulosilytica]ACZ31138.1 hypothetical protein Xcel_2120 [Xylanimonas cellulosilytica DSM 15894]